MENFIIANNMCIFNEPNNPPTFETTNGASYIDLTIGSEFLLNKIQTWKTVDINTSDHRAITFEFNDNHNQIFPEVNASMDQKICNFNIKKAAPLLEQLSTDLINKYSILISQNKIDQCLEKFYFELNKIISSCSRVKKTFKNRPTFWNEQIEALRRQYLKAKKDLYKNKNPDLKEALYISMSQVKQKFKDRIKLDKEKSWENFVKEDLAPNPWGVVYRVAAEKFKKTNLLGVFENDGETSLNPSDAAKRLLHSLLPDDNEENETLSQKITRQDFNTIEMTYRYNIDEVTNTELEIIIKNLKKKAPGLDKIDGNLTKIMHPSLSNFLLHIYNSCLRASYFPKCWKMGNLVVIPKDSGGDPSDIKNYRPITLLNDLGKIFEKLIRTRLFKSTDVFHADNQYGFCVGKSSTDALLFFKNQLQAYNQKYKYTAAVFFDISGAFDNVWYPSIIKSLRQKGVSPHLIRIMKSYVSDRNVIYSYRGIVNRKNCTKGCPQGSVLGPTLWNTILDEFLRKKIAPNTETIAYADDIVVITGANTRNEFRSTIQTIVTAVCQFAGNQKLQVSSSKTKIMMFNSPKRVHNRDLAIKINNSTIQIVTEHKYLGILFDSKFNFQKHINNVCSKARTIMMALRRKIKLRWNISVADSISAIYNHAIIPIVTYGSEVWADRLNISKIKSKLTSLSGLASRCIAGCYASVSNDAAHVLAGVPPLDLEAARINCCKLLKKDQNCNLLGFEIEKSDFDTYKHAREYVAILVEDLWQERWDSSTKGRTTYRFRPIVQSGLRYSHSFAATQILTGHGNFMSHLQRVGKSETDECAECGVRDDPIHRLLVCPLFDVPRRDIYRSVNSPFLSLNWIIHLKSELLEPFTALPQSLFIARTSRIAPLRSDYIEHRESESGSENCFVLVQTVFQGKSRIEQHLDLDADQLISEIQKQQDLPESLPKNFVKTAFKVGNKDGKANQWVVELHPVARNHFIKSGSRLFINWKSLHIRDYLRVTRCFKCQKFGHVSKFCNSEKQCGYCASTDHESVTCKLKNEENKHKCIAAVFGSSPRTLTIPGEGHVEASRRFVPISAAGLQGEEPLVDRIMIGSEDRGVSGLARKRVAADVPGLCEVKRCSVSAVNVESEFGPVPRPPAEPSCCEAPGAPVRARAMGLTTLSGTKTSNSGAQGPSTSAPMQNMAGGFVCDCGRSYALKTSLARHKKECGKNNTECRWCGTRFNTLAGTRQHERKAHFVQYQSDLAKALPQPESELMEKIAIVEARSSNGIFYKEMMASTGLTHQQVRSRREKPEYKGFLERARRSLAQTNIRAGSISPASTIAGSLESASPKAGCSSSASPGPTTRSRAPTKGVPLRSSNSARIVVEAQVHTRAPPNTGETEVALRESRRTVPRLGPNPSRPCGISPLMAIAIDEDSVLGGLRVQAEPSPTAVHSVETFPGTSSMTPMETDRVHNKSGIDPILEHNGTRQVRREESSTREDPVEQWSPNYPKTPVTMPNITTTADASCTSYNRTPQTLPGNRRRRSRSLPPVQRKSASDDLESVDSLGPWAVFLQDQVDAGSLSGNDSLADLVRVALTKSDRGVLNDAVNRYLAQRAESLRIRKRGSKGKRKSKTGRHYGQTTSGSGQRAALFKKHQDLFLKNRRGLAETILSGKEDFGPRPEPPVTSVEEFYGGIFESPSPPDNEPLEVRATGVEDPPTYITMDEIKAARAGWQISAPGSDQIPVAAVKTMSELELAILFNIILFRNVQPSAWGVLRTTLVPKDGDLRNPANWRPITISSAMQRLLHRVLAARLSKLVSLSSSQRGFTEIDGTLANALILHEYLQYRRQTGRTYQVVSLDVRKAFDTVSHCSVSRALGRFGIPSVIREYILATFGAQTTIKCGTVTTRPIRMLRGVRQGDPLSPVLFNLVMDELLEKVNEKYEGGSLQSGERCAIMAFADDLILIADRDQDVPAMLDDVSTFLERRGMSVNPAKCRALIAGAVSGRSVVRTGSSYKIHNTPIPNVDALDAFKYLGLEFGHKGVERPTIHNLSVWLNNLRRAPLKPDQKCLFIRQYVIPRLLYGMQNPQVTSKVLREADRLIRRHLKTYYHLNVHTPDSLIHASVRDGGLGIMELRKAIPRIFLGRLVKLLNKNNDSVLSSVLQSDRVRTLMGKLSTMAGEVPESTFWRNRIASGPLSKGLEQAAEDSASRLWISEKPSGWSGRDHVRAVQLRTGNLPTKAIPSVPVGQRRCRHGCACDESISHVLQMCPLTHADRIRRHDEVVKKVARHCTSRGWTVEVEPHIRSRCGRLFKPDLAVHQPGGAIVIADVQISWDSESLTVPYERKRAKYDVPQFHQAAQHAWPGKALTFAPVIVGARGIWPRINNDRSAALQIPPVVRRACVNSVVKWGSSIHATFMSETTAKGTGLEKLAGKEDPVELDSSLAL
ncbi:hypothetical protein TcasGA2_TC031700 [Tribolium castaneum]|uniref:Reverse transcriptase n=1 Tax=Tribolium castaneum TaxID=7070 RepID=A0A139W914_TRICA|nr:hypothetical protein TcasGA2_TC031700 [Tribolium castaneum]